MFLVMEGWVSPETIELVDVIHDTVNRQTFRKPHLQEQVLTAYDWVR